ncbi:hypothetical protein B6U84_04450 [Candidatus Bathyarchaeota archaeon ex4484_40]|nr:MAG: hypothetical protein B6U84_04450 [Candidatus Bathyarchaeota archaeon ex4484_40]
MIIFLPVERLVDVGRLGTFRFRRGYYLYTGSALGRGALSLDGRVARHLKKSKRLRWHIDHLLSLEEAQVKAVITVETEERMECEVNKYLKERMNAEVPVPGFGSSDCRGGCGSHLLFVLGLTPYRHKLPSTSTKLKCRSEMYRACGVIFRNGLIMFIFKSPFALIFFAISTMS